MTIVYKLFKIPRTTSEFVDNAKRKGFNKIDVSVEINPNPTSIPAGMNFDVTLKSGDCSFNAYRGVAPIAGFGKVSLPDVALTKAFQKAVEIAKDLENSGFDTKVNNQMIKEVETYVSKSKKELRENGWCFGPY